MTAKNMEDSRAWTVSEDHDGLTLAAVVRQQYPGLSWNKARDLCGSGRVTVDQVVVTDGAWRVRSGVEVVVTPTAPRRREGVLASDDIIHLDHDVVVVRKPAGIATVPFAAGDWDTLVHRTQGFLRRASKRSPGRSSWKVRVVQRLDKGTSGLLVFARTHAAETHLQDQFRRHTVIRRYDALAHGRVTSRTYDSMFIEDRGDGLRGSWKGPGDPPPGARRAITHVEVLEALPAATRLRCRLETGRQHQIRIHLAEAGHPLVGETVYIRDYRGALLEAGRPMLHAAELGFEHPGTGQPLHFEDPPPLDYLRTVERLRGREPGVEKDQVFRHPVTRT